MPLADIVVVAHLFFAGFIALGFIAIPFGAWLGWQWIRLRWLRMAHLGGIVFVAAETLVGIACPLTVWEDRLRGTTGDEVGFIARWVRWLLYYNIPLWAFSIIYVVAAVIVVWLWFRVPPKRRLKKR